MNQPVRFTVAILTVSDRAFSGNRDDLGGPAVRAAVEERGHRVVFSAVLPDERDGISAALADLCDAGVTDLVLTTGGTGFSPRDVTPEATIAVTEKLCPGIPEVMRVKSLAITERAMLSRAVAGIRKKTLIINLPGSPAGAVECLEFVLDAVEHGLAILTGRNTDCARTGRESV